MSNYSYKLGVFRMQCIVYSLNDVDSTVLTAPY